MLSSHTCLGEERTELNSPTFSKVPNPGIISENGIKLTNDLDLYKNPLNLKYKL